MSVDVEKNFVGDFELIYEKDADCIVFYNTKDKTRFVFTLDQSESLSRIIMDWLEEYHNARRS